MSHIFEVTPTRGATELRLVGSDGPLTHDRWALEAPATLLPGVDLVGRLLAAESAIEEGETVLIEHRAVAGLTVREAGTLHLPPLADVMIIVEPSGVITRPDFSAALSWRRPTGQPVIGADRIGAWIMIGGSPFRLPDALFAIAEAVDGLGTVNADDLGGRLAAIATLRDVLPGAEASGQASAAGFLGTISVLQAEAFSLDLHGDGEAARLVPILHRADGDQDAELLAPEQRKTFGEDQFNRFSTVRPVYTLGQSTFLVLSPPLCRALSEVRRVQSAPLATKRALLASPRAFLHRALGEDADSVVVEAVFRETTAYSDRVRGLGIWQPRVLPWLKLPSTAWFGPETGDGSDGKARGKSQAGLRVGDERVPLTVEQAAELAERVERAIGAGVQTVAFQGEDGRSIAIPATHETLTSLAAIEAELAAGTEPAPRPGGATARTLIIEPNEEEVGVTADFVRRPGLAITLPRCLATPLKQHQLAGLDWLQQAWRLGRPGVLLADDMGLGKTLQGLAFLAWLREGMVAGTIPRAPLLIVAPTGLLENWREEHNRHLNSPGLGRVARAYGAGIAELRLSIDGAPSLDVERLRTADWVLTTYETLRDYAGDFGQVRFASLLFDEAQKIKTPGVRLTDAAKAMNADFRVALTGTPVENRLSDLWCIVDTVHPAQLGDLRMFSARYEGEATADDLAGLKRQLDHWYGGRAPLLLRRLKEDQLPDLPTRNERITERSMPPLQADRYAAAIAAARLEKRRGAALEALQAIRGICLHPEPERECDDAAFIASSARMQLCFEALDAIAESGESALVFLDDLALQARLAALIQRRYQRPHPPLVINGTVSGQGRQARVNRFQSSPDGFDVMILSPKAGGVGLTLTRANHVLHLSRWWNPAVEDQCTGRVHRIGQTRPVMVHLPMALLPDGRRSFDQNLHALLDRKRVLSRDALMPPAETEADRDALFAETVGTG